MSVCFCFVVVVLTFFVLCSQLVCPLLRCVGNLLSLCPVDSLHTQVGDLQLVVAVCALLQAYMHSQPALARESAWVLNNLTG